MTDAQVTAAFTTYYTRRATEEFAEDIDRVRGAEDFKDDALALLVVALQQGAGMFSAEEQRRVVQAEKEAAAKG
jgi:ribosome assembly protein 3